ncbi:MAG TPA: signal peptidase II [Burkholderiales bacterium]|nr:signal peptidase II [Burkholderiales bacterium]
MLRYLWITAVVVILDQVTKFAAVTYLAYHVEKQLLPFLSLTLTYNRGAAFGFLNDQPGWQKFFFIVVAVAAVAFIFVWLRRLAPHDKWIAVALALILGGAVGNLLDRVIYGYVVDFIDVIFGSWHFWIFNIADSAISIGAVVLVLDTLGIGKSVSQRR